MPMQIVLVAALLGADVAFGQSLTGAITAPRVIEFIAEKPEFATAADDYRSLWATEGVRIVSTMERMTGLKWESGEIRAIVFEGVSSSGFREIPMRLRASYSSDTKRATLVHELGHRLFSQFVLPRDVENHAALFLFLYDVWVDLWGREFADAQVKVELARGGVYPAAWHSALTLTAPERAARWKQLIAAARASMQKSPK